MNKQHRYIGVVLAVLLGLVSFDVHAQDNERYGTSSLTELTVPVTPRNVALGSSLTGGMNGASGVEALVANPAALMLNPSTNAMFSRMNYIADVGVNFFGVAQRFANNNVALTVTSWDYGDIPETTTDDPELAQDRTWSAGTVVVGLTYGRQLTDRIAAGVTVKGLSQNIDDMDARALALDAGMTYVVGESGLRFGVALRNFGPQVGFTGIGLQDQITSVGPGGEFEVPTEIRDIKSELPSLLSFGATYERALSSQLSATVLANFASNSYDPNQYAAGLQLGFQDLLYVRGGLDISGGDQDVVHWGAWNIGGGLTLPLGSSRLTIDYAYRPSDVFDGVNIISGAFTL